MGNLITERVQKAIEESGLSDAEIAKKAGVSATTVWRWRSGETKSFDANKLKTIANALQLSYEWLRFGEGEKFEKNTKQKSIDKKWQMLEGAVGEHGISYEVRDQLIASLRARVKNLAQDLQYFGELLDRIEKIKRDSDE